jgi:cysteine desulfurase / selenocysteine lyase
MTVGQDRGLDVAAIREQLPILQRCVYLNTGTAGVSAAPVVERLLEEVTLFEEEGEVLYHAMQDRMDQARTRVAAYMGIGVDELAFTRNATDGINLVIWGLPWKEGDEILVSDQEHPSMHNPLFHLQNSGGPRVRLFAVDVDPEITLANARALMTPRTRLVACSHVSCETGTRNPARELAALATEHGAFSLIDGAQALGQFPVDVSGIGCDFYIGNGHKWLHGPKGTGFLYVRRDRLDDLRAMHVGSSSFERPTDVNNMRLVQAAKRYESGTRSFGTYSALPAALDHLEGLGWDRVERRMEQLSGYLKDRLDDLPGVTLLSPRSWERSSALVTFLMEGFAPAAMQEYLWQRAKIRSRIFPFRPILRVSTAHFNTEDELDFLIGTLRQMSTDLAS